jgi:hypothetical protein
LPGRSMWLDLLARISDSWNLIWWPDPTLSMLPLPTFPADMNIDAGHVPYSLFQWTGLSVLYALFHICMEYCGPLGLSVPRKDNLGYMQISQNQREQTQGSAY